MDKIDTKIILKGLLESVKEIDTNLPSDIHIDHETRKSP
jgi:hypothetical protein